MNRTVASLIAITLVLGAAAAVFFLPHAETRNDPARAGSGTRTAAAPEGPEQETTTRRDGETLGISDPAVRAALEAMGVEAPAPGPDEAIVTGRIVARDESGGLQEVADATVARHRVGADGSPDPAPEDEFVPSHGGRFMITVSRKWGHEFVVRAPGRSPLKRRVTQEDISDGSHDLDSLILRPLSQVVVRVVSGIPELREELQPVAGMEVQVLDSAESLLARGTTDKSGEIHFGALPRGVCIFRGELPPYTRLDERRTIEKAEEEIVLDCQIAGRLKVRARASSGAVLTRFDLCLDLKHGTYNYVPPDFREVETDEDGWFLMEDVVARKHTLYVSARGHALGKVDDVEVRPGETTEVTVDLPRGFKVRGKVVSRAGGRPVPDAIVFSERDLIPSSVATDTAAGYRPIARATRTGLDGSFVLEDLTEGTHRLSAVHKDHAPGSNPSVKVGRDSGDETVVIELPAGATLHGHCFTKDGLPDEGALVLVIPLMDPNTRKKPPLRSTCDAEGAYEIKHIPPGFLLVMRMAEDGRMPDMKQHTFRDGQVVELNFGEPGKGATLEGRVLAGDGTPITDRMVVLMSTEPTNGIPLFYQGTVGADGTYSISGIKGGDYSIMLAAAGRGSDFAGSEAIRIPNGGKIIKDIIARGGDLLGRVVSKSGGAPITKGDVTLLRADPDAENGFAFVGRADLKPDGTFFIPNVPEGSYMVSISGEGHGQKTLNDVRIDPGRATDLGTIEMVPGGRVVGRVLDSQGQPVEGAHLALLSPESHQPVGAWAFPTNEFGAFEFASVPEGTWLIVASKPGYEFESATVTVSAGGAPRVTVQEK